MTLATSESQACWSDHRKPSAHAPLDRPVIKQPNPLAGKGSASYHNSTPHAVSMTYILYLPEMFIQQKIQTQSRVLKPC